MNSHYTPISSGRTPWGGNTNIGNLLLFHGVPTSILSISFSIGKPVNLLIYSSLSLSFKQEMGSILMRLKSLFGCCAKHIQTQSQKKVKKIVGRIKCYSNYQLWDHIYCYVHILSGVFFFFFVFCIIKNVSIYHRNNQFLLTIFFYWYTLFVCNCLKLCLHLKHWYKGVF